VQVDVVDEQMNPVAHAELVQQGWPLPPQLPHVPFMHTCDPVQVPPAQHTWPMPPHAAQVPPVAQMRLLVLQLDPQHGWVAAPHITQVPPEQVYPLVEQAFPAQHGWFAPPQVVQVLDAQTVPPEQTFPQHG
jgi:hypothetical protein